MTTPRIDGPVEARQRMRQSAGVGFQTPLPDTAVVVVHVAPRAATPLTSSSPAGARVAGRRSRAVALGQPELARRCRERGRGFCRRGEPLKGRRVQSSGSGREPHPPAETAASHHDPGGEIPVRRELIVSRRRGWRRRRARPSTATGREASEPSERLRARRAPGTTRPRPCRGNRQSTSPRLPIRAASGCLERLWVCGGDSRRLEFAATKCRGRRRRRRPGDSLRKLASLQGC